MEIYGFFKQQSENMQESMEKVKVAFFWCLPTYFKKFGQKCGKFS
jgi:hypothetical protein|tara:strand:+ start:618 stop:752 length:135 start_codon:yes stop_codon:yes gene_type:complete